MSKGRLVALGACVSVMSLCAVAVAWPSATHAPGDRDRSFGGDGKVSTGFRHGTAHPRQTGLPRANSLVIDSRRRLVAIGTAARQFALTRYQPDGDLDRSFSGNGKLKTDLSYGRSGRLSAATAGAIDSRGRIVVAGRATVRLEYRFALTRYKPNGELDRSFGNHGVVRTGFEGMREGWANDMVLDSGGRIVAAGLGADHFGLVRYEPNGRIDRSFDTDGKVTTSFGEDSLDQVNSVALDSQGRIVVAGVTEAESFNDPSAHDFALARYEPDGDLDRSFGLAGKVVTDFGALDEANSLTIDGRGRILVAGETRRPQESIQFALARYDPNGKLDPSFGAGGRLITGPLDGRRVAEALVLDRVGRIIVAGRAGHRGNRRFAIHRYRPRGFLDQRFSGNGRASVKFERGARIQGANAVLIDARQRIVAAGYAGSRFALSRLFNSRRH